MKKIEILAPAGNLDSLLAGIHSGADAVYFGYGELNARRNAKNFDEQSLAEASRLCKERGVKMHMTVNTMVYDREYDEVLRTLEIACKYGIDALIVQDLGVAKIVREAAPEMKMHASTQLTVHNVSGAWQAKELGFSRVVLAREITYQLSGVTAEKLSSMLRHQVIEKAPSYHEHNWMYFEVTDQNNDTKLFRYCQDCKKWQAFDNE